MKLTAQQIQNLRRFYTDEQIEAMRLKAIQVDRIEREEHDGCDDTND